MTNNELLEKMSQDMLMRNFSPYTYDFYIRKTREIIKYFNKPFEEVTIEELRDFLFIHLLQERKVADNTVNHYIYFVHLNFLQYSIFYPPTILINMHIFYK